MLLLRICALAGLLAATLLIVPWVVAGAVQIEYDWVRQDVSDLGADTADHGWIQDAGDMASGFLVVAFAVGLYVMLGDRWSGRIGAILIGIFGLLALLMGAVFDLDCSLADKTCRDAEHSSAHSTHELVSGLAGISALVAPFVLAQRFRRSSDWSDRAAFALLCGVAAVLAFVLYIVFQWKTGVASRSVSSSWRSPSSLRVSPVDSGRSNQVRASARPAR